MFTYQAIGVMEYWDLSMELFQAKVKSPVRDWRQKNHVNEGLDSASRKEISQLAHMSPQIHRALATDLLLYDYALSLFKIQTNVTLGTVWT